MRLRSRIDAPHADPVILATLAEPGNDLWIEPSLTDHVAKCRYCLAILAEFGRAHLQEASGSEANRPSLELLAAALHIGAGETARERASKTRFRRRGAMVAAAAAVAA